MRIVEELEKHSPLLHILTVTEDVSHDYSTLSPLIKTSLTLHKLCSVSEDEDKKRGTSMRYQ